PARCRCRACSCSATRCGCAGSRPWRRRRERRTPMNIGKASTASGVSAKMIRYYEQAGLIPEADRSASGYRIYGDADVHRLRFIRRARELGFGMPAITDLLGLWNDRSRRSADVKRLARAHIADLEERIGKL